MSRTMKKLVLTVLTLAVFSLTAVSAVQFSTDTEPMLSAQEAQIAIDPGDLCNNVFIACGGFLACPGGCYCADLGSGSGICLE